MNEVGASSKSNGTQTVESEREAAGRALADAATAGGLTLGEYAQRATAIQQAATVDGVQRAIRSLPAEPAGAAPARLGRWIVAVFGGTRQEGRWRLGKRLWVLAAFGGVKLDLSAAEAQAPASAITVIAILGGTDILAPPGVSVELSGLSLLGGKADRRASGVPLPGSPVILVRAFTFLGGVAIKEAAPAASSTSL
jgi:hypothetical protein